MCGVAFYGITSSWRFKECHNDMKTSPTNGSELQLQVWPFERGHHATHLCHTNTPIRSILASTQHDECHGNHGFYVKVHISMWLYTKLQCISLALGSDQPDLAGWRGWVPGQLLWWWKGKVASLFWQYSVSRKTPVGLVVAEILTPFSGLHSGAVYHQVQQ